MDGSSKRDLQRTQRESSAYFPSGAPRFSRHFPRGGASVAVHQTHGMLKNATAFHPRKNSRICHPAYGRSRQSSAASPGPRNF